MHIYVYTMKDIYLLHERFPTYLPPRSTFLSEGNCPARYGSIPAPSLAEKEKERGGGRERERWGGREREREKKKRVEGRQRERTLTRRGRMFTPLRSSRTLLLTKKDHPQDV